MCVYVKGKHLMGVSCTLGSNEGAGCLCVCAGVCVMSGGVTLWTCVCDAVTHRLRLIMVSLWSDGKGAVNHTLVLTHTRTHTHSDTSVVTCSSWHLPARTPSSAPPQDTSTYSANTQKDTLSTHIHARTLAHMETHADNQKGIHNYSPVWGDVNVWLVYFQCVFAYMWACVCSEILFLFINVRPAWLLLLDVITHSRSKEHNSKHWGAHVCICVSCGVFFLF